MRLVAPFGFYGWGNIGDESTLQGFARLISHAHPEVRVWVASRNPSHTARVEPSFRYFKAVGRDFRRRWARYRAQAYVVPGGTPIMDALGRWPLSELAPLVQFADAQGKPIVFVGTGTEKLQREESKRMVSNIIAAKVLHWSVRCEHDKERLINYGASPERITIAADMAWLLEPVSTDFGDRYLTKIGLARHDRILGVNVNSECFMLMQEPLFFQKIGKFLDMMIERHKFTVLFLCNEVREDKAADKATSLSVVAHMVNGEKAYVIPNEYWSPQQMMSLIGCCHLTVSTRYHFCLFSAIQRVPFLALKRSDKVSDLCWSMNWSYGVSMNNLSVARFSDMFIEIEQRRTSIIKDLQNQRYLMVDKAMRNTSGLDALFTKTTS